MNENGINLTQFEKNNYFYGKLMTVRDFEIEQRYVNEKRHLLNLLIHGIGIVCGLTVKELNKTDGNLKVKLSPGVALDCCGREIVVGDGMVGKELEVNGELSEGSNYLYLKYKECEKEPCPAIANASSCEEVCCYSRVEELFELELGDSPDEGKVSVSGKVTESDGTTPIPGALVEAFQKGVAKRLAFSEPSGDYALMLDPGKYSIRASASGYGSEIELDVDVSDPVTNVNFALKKESSPKGSKELWDDFKGVQYEEHLSSCPECPDARVLLAVIEKSGENLTINSEETGKYRAIVYNIPLLFELISTHFLDFNNPHRVMAEQVKALMSVNNVGNAPNKEWVQNINLNSPDGTVAIEPKTSNNQIEIKLAENSIEAKHIQDGAIRDSKVASDAAIQEGKIAFDNNTGHNHDDTNSRRVEHQDLDEVLGCDPSDTDQERNKHVSNADANNWGKAIQSINGVKGNKEGNITFKGTNIDINSGPGENEITLSAQAIGGGTTGEIKIDVPLLGVTKQDVFYGFTSDFPPTVSLGLVRKEGVFMEDPVLFLQKLDHLDIADEIREKILKEFNLPRVFFKAYDINFHPSELQNNKFKILVLNLEGEKKSLNIRWWAIPCEKEITFEKAVTFDLPSTVVIGEKFDIKGTSSAGTTVDIYVDDVLFKKLDNLVLSDGEFSEEITADANIGMNVPGTVRLKAWIDGPVDVPPGETKSTTVPTTASDGDTVLRLVRPGLSAEITVTVVAQEDSFHVKGTAKGAKNVDIITVAPKGASGKGMEPGSTDYDGITFKNPSVSETDNTFTQKITVDSDADTGVYLVGVFAPGRDGYYGTGMAGIGASLLKEIEEEGYGNLAGKTQLQLTDIFKDVTTQAGVEDLVFMGRITVEAARISLDPVVGVGAGEPLVVTGTTNREAGHTILVTAKGPTELTPQTSLVEDGTFNATFDTATAEEGTYTVKADDGDGHAVEATVNIGAVAPDLGRIIDSIRATHGESIFESIVAERPGEEVLDIINSMMVAIKSKPEGITVKNLSEDVRLKEETVTPILETLEANNILTSTGTGTRKRFILRG